MVEEDTIQFTKEYEAMLKTTAKKTEDHDKEIHDLHDKHAHCNHLHESAQTERKRQGDDILHLTKSILFLSNALIDNSAAQEKSAQKMGEMTEVFNKVIEENKSNKPLMDIGNNVMMWFKVNKWLFIGIVTVAAGSATILHFYKELF